VPASFDPVAFATDPVYVANRARFDADVAPVLETCNSGNCHGAPQSDFFISCGDTPEQRAFNFAQTWAFVDNPVDESQILRIPLAAGAGGGPHTGGDRFADRGGNDTDYGKLRTFAEAGGAADCSATAIRQGVLPRHVQPMLYARGCGFSACHSPAAGNDFKMRPVDPRLRLVDHAREELRDAPVGVHGVRGPRRAPWPRGGQGHPAATAAASHTAVGRSSARPIPRPARRSSIPTTATPFCTLQEWVDIERAADRVAMVSSRP
jgi:hypothetical protein